MRLYPYYMAPTSYPASPRPGPRSSVINIPVFNGRSSPSPPSAPSLSPHRPSASHFPASSQPAAQKRSSLDSAAAAITVQAHFRGFYVRQHRPLLHLRTIAAARKQLEDLKTALENSEFVQELRTNSKERLRFNEAIMAVILRLDAIEGSISEVRSRRKEATRMAINLQEAADAIVTQEEYTDSSAKEEETDSLYANDEGEQAQVLSDFEQDTKDLHVVLPREKPDLEVSRSDGFVEENMEIARKSNENLSGVIKATSAGEEHSAALTECAPDDVDGEGTELDEQGAAELRHSLQDKYLSEGQSAENDSDFSGNEMPSEDAPDCFGLSGLACAGGLTIPLHGNKEGGYEGKEVLCLKRDGTHLSETSIEAEEVDKMHLSEAIHSLGEGKMPGSASEHETLPEIFDRLSSCEESCNGEAEWDNEPRSASEDSAIETDSTAQCNQDEERDTHDCCIVNHERSNNSAPPFSESLLLQQLTEDSKQLKALLGKLLLQSKAQSKVICALADRVVALERQQMPNSPRQDTSFKKRQRKNSNKRTHRMSFSDFPYF